MSAPKRGVDRVADLLCPSIDDEPAAAQLDHFGHERHRIQRPGIIEGAEDLRRAANLDQVASTKDVVSHLVVS
jgi:hypothetical protein